MRALAVSLVVVFAAAKAYAADQPPTQTPPSVEESSPVASAPMTGAVRTGLYTDGDQTVVFRALAAIAGGVGHWILSGTATADVISSASIDVRSSPGLSKVDVTTSASGTTSTSGGKMSDRRLSATAGAGWNDGRGHTFNLSSSVANESDYNSVSGAWNGSIDLFQRVTTLLGGMTFTQNWIGSVLDKSFARQMYAFGWTIGAAQVLTPSDALRLRYDGAAAHGYQASPYRNVRFGDWTTTTANDGRITFGNTLGTADGLAETEPELRLRHGVTLEWVHSFLDGLALHSEARLGTDSWGVQSLTAGVELRMATLHWRARAGYRFYAQSQADFYQPKYLLAATSYTYYTSDKELSRELGHVASIGISRVLRQPPRAGAVPLLLDLTASVLYYDYPDFVLLKSRVSGFVELGLTWEP
ncbi:MAG: lipoprotein [bacterium]|nr:lipoprotein [bacterium]